jgi:hypothetical protein
MSVTLNASTSSGLIATSDTSGQIELQANGVTKATVGSSGLAIGQYNPSSSLVTSGTAVTSTSGTSIDFTSIPSWVKRITVMFNGVSTNGTSNWIVQLGDSGGIETTGYTSSSMIITTAGNTGGNYTTGMGMLVDQAAYALQGQLVLTNVESNTWVSSVILGSGTNLTGLTVWGGGAKTLSATLDRVRITTVAGTATFDAGSINILYE